MDVVRRRHARAHNLGELRRVLRSALQALEGAFGLSETPWRVGDSHHGDSRVGNLTIVPLE
jgi:hypothetical protein